MGGWVAGWVVAVGAGVRWLGAERVGMWVGGWVGGWVSSDQRFQPDSVTRAQHNKLKTWNLCSTSCVLWQVVGWLGNDVRMKL